MELESKHLAPYLPYNLKCQVTDKRKKKIATLGGLYNDGNCVFHDTIESEKGFKRIKPLLLPTSSLYTEMEDGKVPIVEIYKKMFIYPQIKEYRIEDGCLKFGKHTFEWADEFRAFSLDGDTAYITIGVSDYLDNLHFDWRYGLIDKGLALDKTKIK